MPGGNVERLFDMVDVLEEKREMAVGAYPEEQEQGVEL